MSRTAVVFVNFLLRLTRSSLLGGACPGANAQERKCPPTWVGGLGCRFGNSE